MFPRNVDTTTRLHGGTAQETTMSNDKESVSSTRCSTEHDFTEAPSQSYG